MAQIKDYFIGVDVGTQSLRVGIFGPDGECITLSSGDYKTNYPKLNWASQNPHDWWQVFKINLEKCFENAEKNDLKNIKQNVRAISVCATSSTIIPSKSDGTPLSDAIMWMDTRAYREADDINRLGHKVLRYAGGRVSSEWMVPKMLWLKRHQPDLFSNSDYIIEQLDWFNYKLTGEWVVSKCNVTCKWNYIDSKGGWDKKYMEEIGLGDFEEYWPKRVVAVGDKIGNLSIEAAEELNLSQNIIVVQGGIDAYIALLGMGVTDPGELGMIMGSSFVHLTFSEKPVFNNGLWGPYSNALIDGLWVIEGGQSSGGAIDHWFKDNFFRELEEYGKNIHNILISEAENIEPGSEGLIALDFWQGNRTPYKDPLASGSIFGLKLKHTRAHVYRSLLEGVAYGTYNILNTIEESEHKIDKIVACGGGIKNSLWLQIISDVTNVPLVTAKFNEAGLLGCAITAATGVRYYSSLKEAAKQMFKPGKTVNPTQKNHSIYNFYFEKYLELYQKNVPVMHEISHKILDQ